MRTRLLLLIISLVCAIGEINANVILPGFSICASYNEQIKAYTENNIKITINAPSQLKMNATLPTAVIFYALPNGNSTNHTIGRNIRENEDWHYTIQNIGAQTRYLREVMPLTNIVTVYMEADSKSWGTWRRTMNNDTIISNTVDKIASIFAQYHPYVVLSSHSGGGNFIFGYIEGCEHIPNYVKRISFLDSNYNWNNKKYGDKLCKWFNSSKSNYLSVICYNDSVALYNGKRFVSDTGGTWYRTKMMQRYMQATLKRTKWTHKESDSIISYCAVNNRAQFLLIKNPTREIFHTTLVERNGYIQMMLSGTKREGKDYTFFGNKVYDRYSISAESAITPLTILPRTNSMMGGAEFMSKIANMSRDEREETIYNELAQGNIPNAFRNVNHIITTLTDAKGVAHTVEIEMLPDVLAIGSDNDFCRIPMLPGTAQGVATLYNASLPTSKLSDLVYTYSAVRLMPHPMTPDSTMVTVPVYIAHNTIIEQERRAVNYPLSAPITGHKKDIIITNRIATQPKRLFIYGWHYPDGSHIQPISGAHGEMYVDYSHGVRMVNKQIVIDGELYTIDEILRDPVLYKLISDEDAPMQVTEYPTDFPLK